jgi:hypothetical protein
VTAVSNRRSASSSPSFDTLPGALIDQLAEAVMFPPDPHARSVAIARLAAEIFETIRWLHGSDPDNDELASLYRVLAEAYAHRARMAARTVVTERR